ncbi:MAG: hypothetical protein Aurels2KO_29780 [Aureliella sp.]
MRKILTTTFNGIAASTAAIRRRAKTAFGFSLAVTFSCLSTAVAQQPTAAQTLAPTATGGSYPVSFASAGGTISSVTDMPTVDASYSPQSDSSLIQPASHFAHSGGGYLGGNPCAAGCDVSYYVNYEALWLRREDDRRYSLSRLNFMPDWDFEFGGRYTIGTLEDCVNGWELSYVGPYDWNRFGTASGSGTLQSNLVASNGFTAGDIDAFNNADQHIQSWRASMQSFEINRKWWTWDVLSTSIGVRYVDYEEDFRFFSTRSGVGNGVLNESVDNELLGVQVGVDMLFPVSLRGNVGFKGKGGVYANFDERNAFVSNAGTTIINSGDSDVDVAGIIELGVFGNYHIVPSVRLTAAYEFWYMPGVATVPEQLPRLITANSGTTLIDDGEVLLHGGSVGLQILF